MENEENNLCMRNDISAVVPEDLYVTDINGKCYCSIKTHMQFDLSYDGNFYNSDLVQKILITGKRSLADHHQSICRQLAKDKQLVNDIIDTTKFLDVAVRDDVIDAKQIKLAVRVYCILNDISQIPCCSYEECRQPLRNFNPDRQCVIHSLFCSIQHMGKSKMIISKRVNGYMNRSPEQKLKTKIQTEQTILERFGNKCFMKTDYFKEKQKEFIVDNGGVNNVSQIEEVREKVKTTNVERFGYECNLAAPECIEKKTQTYMEHFGVDHCMKCPEVVEKQLNTFERKYGSRSASNTPRAIRRRKARQLKLKLKAIRENQRVELVTSIQSISEIILNQTNLWWRCLDCGHVFYGPMVAVENERIVNCPFCEMENRGSVNHSAFEYEIAKFIRESFPELEVYHCDNKVNRHIIYPKEIDIWIPEKKIGIECEGVYWHSVEFQEKYSDELFNSISEKTQLCEEKGIHLIHIFQDEWLIDQDEVKEMLVNFIRGDYDIPEYNDDKIVLSHDKYPSFLKIEGFHLAYITGDDAVTRYAYKQRKSGQFTRMKKKYHVYSSGQLVFVRD